MSDGFGLRPLYAANMPMRQKDEDEQTYSDRVRQYDNLNQQNNLIVQQALAEQAAQIIALQSALNQLQS